jgi:SAM-dependent methyltransferase
MIALAAGAAFDALAERYDEQWSESVTGRKQRAAVWRWVQPLFHAGDRILDLGCGTGVDAAHFIRRGIEVLGIDASQEMVRLARSRGVNARQLPIELLGRLTGEFDGAISNFGALNCVSDLESVSSALGRLIRTGGYVALCFAGGCCVWETLYYLWRRKPAKALRRLKYGGTEASLGVHIEYPPVCRLVRMFRRDFRLIRWCGIGLCLPPSYVEGISEHTMEWLGAADRRFAHCPVLRGLADHRLVVLQRI